MNLTDWLGLDVKPNRHPQHQSIIRMFTCRRGWRVEGGGAGERGGGETVANLPAAQCAALLSFSLS